MTVGWRVATLLVVPLALSPFYQELCLWSGLSVSADAQDGEKLALRCGSFQIPDKRKKNGGEDALFIEEDAVGVFDGVGGWADYGVDAGIYARTLATVSAREVRKNGPKGVIAALKTAVEENGNRGSSTACTVGLVNGNILHGVNVGDSGLMVLRGTTPVFRSVEQQVRFNFPYQLGTGSPHRVDDGTMIHVELQAGDTVVLATDGVFDNVHDPEIINVISQSKDEPLDRTAERIANVALIHSGEWTFDSPFSQNARKAGLNYQGGKVDDITVVFCRTCERSKDALPKAKL